MSKKIHRATIKGLNKFINLLLSPNIEDFKKAIVTAREKINIPQNYLLDDKFCIVFSIHALASKLKDQSLVKEVENFVEKNRLKFMNSDDSKSQAQLLTSINKIMTDYELGAEWAASIADMIISNYFSFPVYNLTVCEDNKSKTFSINIFDDTSLEDITNAWKNIKEKRDRFFHNKKETRAKYITMKSIKNDLLLRQFHLSGRELKEDLSIYCDGYATTKGRDILDKMYEHTGIEKIKSPRKKLNNLSQLKRRNQLKNSN